jgi:prophage regulatory protein
VDISHLVLLARKQVELRTALSKSALYARLDKNSPQYDPTFPRPVAIDGGLTVRWVASEVDAWVAAKIAAARAPGAVRRTHRHDDRQAA